MEWVRVAKMAEDTHLVSISLPSQLLDQLWLDLVWDEDW